MNVNPYVTPEYQAPAVVPTEPAPAQAQRKTTRKTNWVARTGALVGLGIGLATTSFPVLEGLEPYDQGRAMGEVTAHVIGCLLAGYTFAWLVGLLFSRLVMALLFIGGAVSLALVLAPAGYIALSRADLSRHQGGKRVQYENEGFSLVPPPSWRRAVDGPSSFTYAAPVERSLAPYFCVFVHQNQRLTIAQVAEKAREDLPDDATYLNSGKITIDGKDAFFQSSRAQVLGKNIRYVQYLVPRPGKVCELRLAWREPLAEGTRQTLSDVVASVRVD